MPSSTEGEKKQEDKPKGVLDEKIEQHFTTKEADYQPIPSVAEREGVLPSLQDFANSMDHGGKFSYKRGSVTAESISNIAADIVRSKSKDKATPQTPPPPAEPEYETIVVEVFRPGLSDEEIAKFNSENTPAKERKISMGKFTMRKIDRLTRVITMACEGHISESK